MKPREKLATTQTPDGGEMALYRHDHDYALTVNANELMNSRQHESELELARLGCAHLTAHKSPRVLIGGLGMGYTLRQVLDMLRAGAQVIVAELLPDVVEWNREYLGALNGQPLNDARVELHVGDVVELVNTSAQSFDAILLDIDNGPSAMTDSGNMSLYGRGGMQACRRALRERGCLAIWSSEPNKTFEQMLVRCGFHVRRYRAPAYKGSRTHSHYIWVACENEAALPEGGGAPRMPPKRPPKPKHGRGRWRH